MSASVENSTDLLASSAEVAALVEEVAVTEEPVEGGKFRIGTNIKT